MPRGLDLSMFKSRQRLTSHRSRHYINLCYDKRTCISYSCQTQRIIFVCSSGFPIRLTMACSCDNGFASSYMILKPEEVGLVDLIKILLSPNLEDRKFVDCPEGTEEQSFRRRRLIFVSIFLQKSFQFVAKPLAYLGSTIELYLNMISCNRNVLVLILNSLRG